MKQTGQTQIRSHAMRFGAEVGQHGTRFRLWAPRHKHIRLKLKDRRELLELEPVGDGWHRLVVDDALAGTLYKYVLPDDTEIADPFSRFQPAEVNGWSEVIDPAAFPWTDGDWTGRPWEEAIIYEIHVGAFTAQGSFSAAIEKLPYLKDLGVTAIQLMPVAEFFGDFNWGYDGVLWFAPDSSYGRPEDFKRFVDAAHAHGLMVLLDVVYNHFGADGNNLSLLAPIFTKRHKSPWGKAINYDGDDAPVVREMAIESALYWLTEFNLDGLRFDSVHTIADDSTTHLLEVMAARLRASRPHRHTHLVIENAFNQEQWLRRTTDNRPVHYTAQWNDDLHHLLHVSATGESTGYYGDYSDLEHRTDRLARALGEGFAYQGEVKPREGTPRGEPSAGLPSTAFVSYIQNHDQVGNRIKGDRITALAPAPAVRAISAILLLAPHIPMLFMGEEWATPSPFPFFSDVPAEKRKSVRKGRQEQLKRTPEHDDPDKPEVTEALDPTTRDTFALAKLDWDAAAEEPHGDWLRHYRLLIDLRHREIVPRLADMGGFGASFEVMAERAVRVSWRLGDASLLHLHANLHEEPLALAPAIKGRVIHREGSAGEGELGPWSVLWTIED